MSNRTVANEKSPVFSIKFQTTDILPLCKWGKTITNCHSTNGMLGMCLICGASYDGEWKKCFSFTFLSFRNMRNCPTISKYRQSIIKDVLLFTWNYWLHQCYNSWLSCNSSVVWSYFHKIFKSEFLVAMHRVVYSDSRNVEISSMILCTEAIFKQSINNSFFACSFESLEPSKINWICIFCNTSWVTEINATPCERVETVPNWYFLHKTHEQGSVHSPTDDVDSQMENKISFPQRWKKKILSNKRKRA